MKGKTRWLALLLAACMLVLCGCGKNAVNKEESQPVVQETAEPVQETEEPVKETAEPTEETALSAEDPAEKAEETAKPDGNTEEAAEPEAGTEAETATEPEDEEPEPSAKPEPSAEPEPGNAAVEEQSAEKASETEPPVTEEKTEETSTTETKEESEPAEAEEAAAETAPAEEETESAPEAEETAPEAEETAPEAEETAESAPEAEEPEVRRTVEITVPAEYADVRYRIGEVTWNPDDSATYRLTEEEHEQLLEEVRSEIQSELNDMCASPYFLDFYSMTANEDCTVFTVVCLSIETTKAEQKSIPQLYKFGRMYAAYAGREPGNIHIDYMNKIGNTFVMRDSERDEGQASIG